MSDIFREVEEEVRKDRLEKWWKAYGDYVIALLALTLVSVAGYELWVRYQASQQAKAATAFVAAQRVTDPAKAAEAFDTLGKSAPGGYAILAKLSKADALPATGKVSDAIALYKEIAGSDSGPIGAAARLRAAWLEVDSASHADLTTLLAPVNTADSPWRLMAREVLAYNDFKSGNTKEAMFTFQSLARDPETPQALRSRAQAFAEFLQNGGARDYGSVPPPATAPAPGTPPGKTPTTKALVAKAPAAPKKP